MKAVVARIKGDESLVEVEVERQRLKGDFGKKLQGFRARVQEGLGGGCSSGESSDFQELKRLFSTASSGEDEEAVLGRSQEERRKRDFLRIKATFVESLMSQDPATNKGMDTVELHQKPGAS